MPPSCSSVSIAVLHELRLIEHHVRDQFLRHVEQMRDRVLDAVHDRNRVGVAALLQHRQIDRRLAVHAHDVVLDLLRVLGVADVAHASPTRCPTVLIGS